jgi:Flp pilus assembly protein TadG
MRWLRRRLQHQHREQGAIAAIVAILLTCGVLTGMGALVVDGGQIYAARAQMQNGADGAAMAIARACASTPVGPACASDPNNQTSAAYAAANTYAASNAAAGSGHIAAVCGSTTVFQSACPARDAANPLLCPKTPAGNYVEVHTETGVDANSRLLPPVFGRALLGSSYTGKSVGACAQAAWGPISVATGMSVTFSKCAWSAATSGNTALAPPPPYGSGNPWPPGPAYPKNSFDPATPGLPGGEQVLALHGSGNDCAGNLGSGWNYPGGFGWLVDDNGLCQTKVNVANTYSGIPGNAANEECESLLDASRTKHTVVYVPIFDGVNGTGVNGTYHLAGFAAFVLTGGLVKGQGPSWDQPSSVSGKRYCSGSDRCLYGYFTHGLIPASALPGGTDFGASVVSLTG